MTKVCKICGIVKDETDFPKYGGRKLGRRTHCWDCHKVSKKVSYHANKKLSVKWCRSLDADGLLECAGCHTAKPLAEFGRKGTGYPNSVCKRCHTEYNFKAHRGVGYAERSWLQTIYDGCWLCGKRDCQLVIDHDHSHEWKHPPTPTTLRKASRRSCKECIRGLLCQLCNRVFIPILERVPDLVAPRSAGYLELRPFIDSSLCEQYAEKYLVDKEETSNEESQNLVGAYELVTQR